MKKPFIISTIVFFCIILIIAVLTIPFFDIDVLTVTGNNVVSDTEVVNMIYSEKDYKNIFAFPKRPNEKKIKSIPYIKDASIQKKFPNKVNVDIEERKCIGYVKYNETYIYIDEEGIALQTGEIKDGTLPIFDGYSGESVVLGEPVILPYENVIFNTINILESLENYGIKISGMYVDMNNSNNTYFKVGKTKVYIGDNFELDKKIRLLLAVMENSPDLFQVKSILDISNPEKGGIYQYGY